MRKSTHRQIGTFGVTDESGAGDHVRMQRGTLELVEQADWDSRVQETLHVLDCCAAQVLRMRFGIGSPPYSARELAQRLGVTKTQLRQIEAQALRTLRKRAAEAVSAVTDRRGVSRESSPATRPPMLGGVAIAADRRAQRRAS
jgi:hypothetical protein